MSDTKPGMMTPEEINELLSHRISTDRTALLTIDEMDRLCAAVLAYHDAHDDALEKAAQLAENQFQSWQAGATDGARLAAQIRSLKRGQS